MRSVARNRTIRCPDVEQHRAQASERSRQSRRPAPHERFPGQRRGEAQRDLRRQRAREANLGVARGAQVVIALLGAVVGRGRVGDAGQNLRAAVDLGQRIGGFAGHGRRGRDVGQRVDGRRRRAERDRHRQAIFWRRRLPRAVEVGDEIVGQIMADAVLDRRDFDRPKILDQPRMRGLAVERLEATRRARRASASAARTPRPLDHDIDDPVRHDDHPAGGLIIHRPHDGVEGERRALDPLWRRRPARS